MVMVSFPVIAGVGAVPTSPVIVVSPMLVTPAPASTAKLSATPSGTSVAIAWALPAVLTRNPAVKTVTAAAHAAALLRARP